MRIKDILLEKGNAVVTIGAEESVHAAIVELNNHGFGALVVLDQDGKVGGIVTERDILKCCGETCDQLQKIATREHAICQVSVGSIMTRDLIIGVPDDDINFVMGVMTKHRIRHLPILDEGKLVGIISISDLVNAHLEENVIQGRTLKEYIHGWSHTS